MLESNVEPTNGRGEATMIELGWLACTDPTPMLEFLRGKASERKLRLFACACCRDIWNLIRSESSRRALEASEDYADGKIRRKKLIELRERARQNESDSAQLVVMAASRKQIAAFWVALLAAGARDGSAITPSYTRSLKSSTEQSGHLRDIFGNPFRPLPNLDPTLFTWNDATIPKPAQGIYDNRNFTDLPILADALEEAGCDNADLLNHCRQPGEHVRGCWALDLVLGRQ
jgi:hypothetical protein